MAYTICSSYNSSNQRLSTLETFRIPVEHFAYRERCWHASPASVRSPAVRVENASNDIDTGWLHKSKQASLYQWAFYGPTELMLECAVRQASCVVFNAAPCVFPSFLGRGCVNQQGNVRVTAENNYLFPRF